MIEVALKNGGFALCDESDADLLLSHTWRGHKGPTDTTTYALSARNCRMHRLLLSAPQDVVVDHINGNGLDNRRSNLRLCSIAENSRSRRRSANNSTGYKGVQYQPRFKGKPFKAFIGINYQQIPLGSFTNAHSAALAYDQAAIEHHGEFAKLNFDPARDWIHVVEERLR